MTNDFLNITLRDLRGTDSNSLLRMYDHACGARVNSASQLERGKAEKAVQRIAGELKKRHVLHDDPHSNPAQR